jgi:hypothetical protein
MSFENWTISELSQTDPVFFIKPEFPKRVNPVRARDLSLKKHSKAQNVRIGVYFSLIIPFIIGGICQSQKLPEGWFSLLYLPIAGIYLYYNTKKSEEYYHAINEQFFKSEQSEQGPLEAGNSIGS